MASQPDAGELRDELKAHLRARQELSEEMEDEVVESFLGKIEESINQRVEERVDEALGRRKRFRIGGAYIPVVLCLSIPLVAIAGALARGLGVRRLWSLP